jgi:DNA invertase Pin-like site-specific DNA recombinase
VLDLTRLGRDTRELLAIVEDDLHANGRHFRTLDGIVLDTSDDMCGELIFTVFAAIAKFQRQQIVKGTREGLDAPTHPRPRRRPPSKAATLSFLISMASASAIAQGPV